MPLDLDIESRLTGRALWWVLMPLVLWGCASLPPQVAHEPVAAYPRSSDTGLGALVAAAEEPHAGLSGFMVLDTGREAFLQRARLIEAAQRSVDAQYYIWNDDRSGRYLACRLYAAAERGVRVRLILDDMNILGRDAVIAALDRHPKVAIRIFNPNPDRGGLGKWLAFGAEFQRLNRRMHNKSFTVDAAFGIVGGRNIGDEYFDLHPAMNFRDRDVLAAGPIVARVSANFDAYWNAELSYPVGLLAPAAGEEGDAGASIGEACSAAEEAIRLALGPRPAADEAGALVAQALAGMTWAEAELVFDPPASGRETGADKPGLTALALQALVEESSAEILVESAYFILGDEQLARLASLRSAGIRVAALTNSLASNDLTTNHSGYARRRKAKLAAGLELFELRPDAAACVVWIEGRDDCGPAAVSLHSKSAVFDRRVVYVGSFNINLRSMYLNSETVLLIHSQELAGQVAEAIELAMAPANSWRVTMGSRGGITWSGQDGERWTHEPATGYWHRVRASLFRLVPMEQYL
jgi:cardiolipin synthase C